MYKREIQGNFLQLSIKEIDAARFGIGFFDRAQHPNFIQQLYKANQIAYPVLTMLEIKTLFVGGYAPLNCTNEWTNFPVNLRPEGGWTIKVDQLDLFGISFKNQLVSAVLNYKMEFSI
jgi:hypothetical protein